MKILNTLLLIILGLPISLSAQMATRIPMGQNIDKSKELQVSQVVEDIRFIPLETNTDCYLEQDISKIEVFDNMIFISDYKYIYTFDLNGKFLRRIGKQGRGPGEYSPPGFQTFLIDKENKQLIIYDLMSKRMIVYDFEGKFIRNKTIDFLPGPMEWINEESFAIYNMGFTYEKEPWYDFYILDKEGETLRMNKFVKLADKKYGLVVYPPIFYTYQGKTRYKNPHENIIYELGDSKKPTPVYFIDYGKYEKYSDEDDVQISIKNNVGINRSNPKSFEKIGLLGLSETDDFLFIFYGHQEKRKVGVYDKKENSFYQLLEKEGDLYGLKDDLYGGIPLFPKNGISNGTLYTHIDIHELKEYLIGASGADPLLKKIAESANESDNPIVVVATLKQ